MSIRNLAGLSRLAVENLMSLPLTDEESCSQLNALIGTAFGDDKVSRQTAQQLVEQKVTHMPDNTTTCYQMIVDDLIKNRLPNKPDMDGYITKLIADKIVIEGVYSQEAKVEVMSRLANMYETFTLAQVVQKVVIETIFEIVRTSGREDAFLAGISSVYKINDDYNKLTGDYIFTFNKHAVTKDDPIGKNNEIVFQYLNAVGVYSDIQAVNMQPVVEDTMLKWFANPHLTSLWLSLMEMSKVDKQCAVGLNETGQIISQPLNVYVEWQLKNLYEQKSLPEKENIAAEVVKHLNDTRRGGISDAHVNFLDYLLARGPKEVREAMLDALKEVDIKVENEMPVVRVYLKIIYSGDDELRTNAILQGERRHEFNHKVVTYLIHNDAENLRNPAHYFVTDFQLIGEGKKAPIHEYYNEFEPISEVEEVCGMYGEKSPDTAQSERTIQILYKEYRKRHPLNQVEVTPARVTNYFGLDNPMERSSLLFGGRYDRLTEESSGGIRFLYGFEALSSYVNVMDYLMAGGRLGLGVDVSDDLFAKMAALFSYVRINDKEDDLHDVPFKEAENLGGGQYKLKTTSSSFTFNGAALGVEPEFLYYITDYRDRRKGGGITGSWYAGFSTAIGLWFGKLREDKSVRTFDPPDGDITYSSESGIVGKFPESYRGRNEYVIGHFESIMVLLGYEWN